MKFWHKIHKALSNRHNLYLLTVVKSVGSAPGRVGFKMVVIANGELFGSIGGGIMEYNMVENAKNLLSNKTIKNQVFEQVHRGDVNSSSGMICSGSQVISFNYLSPNDLTLVSSVIQAPQIIELSNNGIALISKSQYRVFSQKSPDRWCYCENIQSKLKVHIFGAGHVSLPTTQLLTQIGFDVLLYDNRKGINTYEQNSLVKEKRIISYSCVLREVDVNPEDYVLLMTHKFTEDKLLLTQLLKVDTVYIGVLGSQNKIGVMFESLVKEGVKLSTLEKIKAPVGLNIKSQTVEEIAISIAAEIVQFKNT